NDSTENELHRKILIGAWRPSGRGLGRTQICEAAFQSTPDDRERSDQADDAAGRNGAGADVQNVRFLDLSDGHVLDEVRRFGRQRRGPTAAEILDGGNENKVRQHSAADHDRCDTRADDITNAEQRRIILDRYGTPFERLTENPGWILLPRFPDLLNA